MATRRATLQKNQGGSTADDGIFFTGDVKFLDENGEAVYRIVRSKDTAGHDGGAIATATTYLSTQMRMFLGNTNRAGVVKVENQDDYKIAIKGKKVYINGGSIQSTAIRSTDPNYVFVADDKFHVNAGFNDTQYIGGMLMTDRTMLYKYGYLEMSVVLPSAPGLWTSLWLDSCWHGQSGKQPGVGFHTFGLLWDETKMTFACDGQPYFTYNINTTLEDLDGFHAYCYIRLSAAIGFNNNPMNTIISDDDERWLTRNKFIIDYVHIYQLDDDKQMLLIGKDIWLA